ncbi:MAG: peptidylprolyl isomerase [Acidobacteria bacterium]|nr:peptidylprolyl isomerase [Acidobacteriota bacterium]
MGAVTIEMDPRLASKTVNNFVFLARAGFYNGLIFHRVIKDFMIQGGDPESTGSGGPGYQFEDETAGGQTFDKVGLLAMANSGPNTNGSQFFITVSKPSHLNGKHTIFGKVVKGYDVVERISRTQTAAGDRPVKDVRIRTVTITERAR